MRWSNTILLLFALVAHTAVAELTFTVEATQKGAPIPKSEIKLEPLESDSDHMHLGRPAPPPSQTNGVVRRSNPTANSANWCGAVNTTPSSNPIKTIHGVFQHPTCSQRAGITTYPQAAANWVGIDGDSWTSALLQAGTVCKIDNSTGVVRNEAWWQWVPSASYTISSMPVSADDWFEVTIETTSSTQATITLTNLSTLTTYTITITSGPHLARLNADWVVERPYYGSTLAPFASFTDVWFDEAWASRTGAADMGMTGAKQYQIVGLCASQEWSAAEGVSWSL
ncbi:hypothetical protein N0V88_001496 [Collariella sp. IMI 366227]|nr:hypothetical protein N0V88_001496 [Collariella sp. IMI 366227]